MADRHALYHRPQRLLLQHPSHAAGVHFKRLLPQPGRHCFERCPGVRPGQVVRVLCEGWGAQISPFDVSREQTEPHLVCCACESNRLPSTSQKSSPTVGSHFEGAKTYNLKQAASARSPIFAERGLSNVSKQPWILKNARARFALFVDLTLAGLAFAAYPPLPLGLSRRRERLRSELAKCGLFVLRYGVLILSPSSRFYC